MGSCRSNMTNEQYSRFQRYLGILEGYGMAFRQEVEADLYWDTIENLTVLGEELAPEVGEP